MTIVAVLGASGLIGNAIATDLKARGMAVLALARSFTAAQKAALDESAMETALLSLDGAALAALLAPADILVNCIGVLQAAPGVDMEAVHRTFPDRLATI
jgi:putative NADH-flavin reductase